MDTDGDAEGLSKFQWYLCNTNNTDDEGSAILDATSRTYEIPATSNIDTVDGLIVKDGKYLKFEVTPIAASGETIGSTVKSEASSMRFIDE